MADTLNVIIDGCKYEITFTKEGVYEFAYANGEYLGSKLHGWKRNKVYIAKQIRTILI